MYRATFAALAFFAGCHGMTQFPTTQIPPPEPVEVPPAQADDGLTLAARCIESGDHPGAVGHLQKHVSEHPDEPMIRAYLAELLTKMRRHTEAAGEFERFIADAQHLDGPARNHMIHCHTRLMELAQERSDAYTEHLHRGIGLVLLAKAQSRNRESFDASITEQVLCKAITELREASKAKPREAKPEWYLYEAFTLMAQRHPAEKALFAAKANAAFSELTAAERRELATTR